jgi:Transposase DDE domain group 1
MRDENGASESHPLGEREIIGKLLPPDFAKRLAVDTDGGRFHVEWDENAPVTPLGQLVFFMQFLAAGGLFADWVRECPLRYESTNAPEVIDVLGTMVLGVLSGQRRYAHLNALRADSVNPRGLGMSAVCSEDSVRRAFLDADENAVAEWQRRHLRAAWEPALALSWVLDIDTTIKPIYGHQEGATLGYNPHKPGRPSHAYHTYFIATLRLVLDVEVSPGNKHASAHGFEGLWRLWDGFTPAQRPEFIRGDAPYGQELLMAECERRGQKYLFRQRKTKGIKTLIKALDAGGRWVDAGAGWQSREGRLRLQGWSAERRIVVLRRPVKSPRQDQTALPESSGETTGLLVEVAAEPEWEHIVLVTNLDWEPRALAHAYRQRADCENAFDELKNQWGWGGFVTRDLFRSRVAARTVALVYNWWTIFVRCAEPTRPREAITSRPLMLCAVGRITQHAGQSILRLTSSHAEAARVQQLLSDLSMFLSSLLNTAEQLSPRQRWERIWQRVLEPYRARAPASPRPTALAF